MWNRSLTTLAATATLILTGCGGSPKESTSEEPPQLDRRTEIRLKQYLVQGKQLYHTYCVNCHQANGEGLAQLYPPLAESDYLLEDLPRTACIIKNGKTDEIMVNGQKFNQMMPGFPNLTPLEVAEILTYITNNWGNNKGLSPVKEVEVWLKECEGGL